MQQISYSVFSVLPSCRIFPPFLIFWMEVSEAPLVPTASPTLGVGTLGEDSMVGVPLGEYVKRELPKLCRRPSRRLLSMAA